VIRDFFVQEDAFYTITCIDIKVRKHLFLKFRSLVDVVVNREEAPVKVIFNIF